MSDPYLEDLERAFKAGARDLHDAGRIVHPHMTPDDSFRSICLTFDNGLLKGYWKIVLAPEDPDV